MNTDLYAMNRGFLHLGLDLIAVADGMLVHQ
jgi:hypothetical protein